MTATVRHLTSQRVAPERAAPALAWLARQRAWERRLEELERRPGVTTTASDPRPPARDLQRTA